MKVLLVSANTERVNMPTIPLGLGLVAAATRRAGHQITFLDLMFQREPLAALAEALRRGVPDVIGVSVRNIDDQSMQSPRFLLDQVRPVVAACREGSSAPVVLGGAGFSMFPEQALERLDGDFGVWGGGEVAFPSLLERLWRGEDPAGVAGVIVRGRGVLTPPTFAEDLRRQPLPDDDLLASIDPRQPDLWVPVETRRGCPNDCSYCATGRIQGRVIRMREPAAVADAIGRMAGAGFERFYFVDNSFNLPEAHALDLCGHLRRLGLKLTWRCIIYPSHVSEELAAAMAEAGCVEAALGFESGCPRILEGMNKHFAPDDVRRTAETLARHGIRRMGFLMFGAPGETRESVEESLSFAESLPLDGLKITVGIRIYPGTPLAEIAARRGMIAAGESLLTPRFYLEPGLAPWIHERVTPGMRG